MYCVESYIFLVQDTGGVFSIFGLVYVTYLDI